MVGGGVEGGCGGESNTRHQVLFVSHCVVPGPSVSSGGAEGSGI